MKVAFVSFPANRAPSGPCATGLATIPAAVFLSSVPGFWRFAPGRSSLFFRKASMIDADRLSTLICAKILHDLASPIGTINNVLELMDDKGSGTPAKVAFDLLKSSSHNAMTRVHLNRFAYAMREDSRSPESLENARAFIAAALENTRTELQWNAGSEHAPGLFVKFMTNLVLLGLECAPRGGKVGVHLLNRDPQSEAMVEVEGPHVAFQAHVTGALAGKELPPDLAARDIQAWYVRRLADKLGAELSAREEEGRIRLAARLPAGWGTGESSA